MKRPLRVRCGIAHHVHAAMHTMEPPPLRLANRRVFPSPSATSCARAYDPMLPPRQLRNPPIEWVLSDYPRISG